MISTEPSAEERCVGCVYYPPNLPPEAYPTEDFRILQQKSCSFDFLPGDEDCIQARKTSCSLVDLAHITQN